MPFTDEEGVHYFKVLILGDSDTGKTALRRHFIEGKHPNVLRPTMGTDFGYKTVRLGSIIVKLGLWDVSGKERFANVRRLYYHYCNGAILVFDLTRKDTLFNLGKWILELVESTGHSVPCVLVGTKYDLRDKIYQDFSRDKVLNFAMRLSMYIGSLGITIPFIETSSISNYNVSRPFTELAYIMHRIVDHCP